MKKRSQTTYKIKEAIDVFLEKYPNTEYAIDLKFKKDLVQNQTSCQRKCLLPNTTFL